MSAVKKLYDLTARTASPTPLKVQNPEHKGAQIIINVSAISATPSVTFHVEGHDEAGDTWYELLASAAITAIGVTVLTVYPGASETANVSTNKSIPLNWRVRANHSDADSITYSVGANMLN